MKTLFQKILEVSKTSEMPEASCVLLRKGNFVLSVSRKDDPNDIGLPGGKKEANESSLEAAIRELEEETGLIAKDLRFLYGGVCAGGKDGVDYWTTTYVGDFEGEIDTNESGEVKWVPILKLLGGSFDDYNRRLLSTLGVID